MRHLVASANFDGDPDLQISLEKFLLEMDDEDADFAQILRDNIQILPAAWTDVERRHAREEFNSQAIAALDALLAKGKEGE
jgi:hypothetical protein